MHRPCRYDADEAASFTGRERDVKQASGAGLARGVKARLRTTVLDILKEQQRLI